MLMAAIAASPKVPAATLRLIVARLAVPCLNKEGRPPAVISLKRAADGMEIAEPYRNIAAFVGHDKKDKETKALADDRRVCSP